MGTFFKDSNGTFRRVPKMFLKNSDGTWRGVVKAFIKDSFGTWREIFNASYLSPQVSTEPELTSNDSLGYFDQGSTITLNRGTWTNSPTSYSLSIEGSLDGTNWTTVATGSGTTVTYLITLSDATYPSYSFRGKVVATNAYGPGTFYTTAYSSTITLDVTATVSSPTANGATFSWSVNPSATLYRREQTIVFYDSLSPATAAYTYIASPTTGSAVVSNAALISGRTYSAYVIVVSYDTEESVNLSNELTFTTVAPVPVGTDDTVTFSRDSQSSYNYSITSVGTWTGTPTSYRYQWYTYESTFGGNYSYFPISGATSSTFNASGVKLFEIMPIVWATNSFGESSAGYSLTNTNGTRPAGNIGSISAAANQIVYYKAPVISAFAVTGGAGSATYTYTVTNDDPTIILSISYSGQATGSFTPGVSGSVRTGLAAGTYNFVLTATNSVSGNSYFVTSTVANVIVTAPLTAPVNTLAPAVTPVTGTAGVTTYTTTNGTWTGNPTPTFTYQWQYNDQGSTWVSMSGATSSTFSPTTNFFTTEARVSPIRCRVTATNSQAPSGVAATSNEVVVSRPVYVVTYDYQGATGGNGTASVNVTQGNSTSLPTPTRTNYTFGGWYTAITGGTFIGNGGFAYTPTASITLYARWTAINWTVSWDANGGTVSPTSNTGIQGSTVTAPTPTRTNFTFLYWRDSLSAVSYLYQLSAGGTWTQSQTITFYAWWQQITYLVTYNANGGSVSPASATVNAGSATTLPTPTRANFTFNGWYTAASGGSLVGSGGGSYTPTAAITLYAQWTAVIVNYTVTWNAVGGSGGGTTVQQAGVAHTAPSPGTQLGYTFNGYYNTSAGDFLYGPIASGGSFTPPSTISMFARWTAIIPNISSITVTGNVTAGVTCSAVMTNTQSVQYVLYGRDTTSSAWTQLGSGTASANGTSLTSAISTTSSVGTLPDQYYVTMLPFFGARSTSGTGGGTGTSGTTRSTIGNPKSNASGSVTVTY